MNLLIDNVYSYKELYIYLLKMKLHNDLIMELPCFVPESLCKHLIGRIENEDVKVQEFTTTGWDKEDKILYNYIKTASELYTKYLHDEYNYEQPIHTFQPLLRRIDISGLHDRGYTIQRQTGAVKYGWNYDQSKNPTAYLYGILYLNTLEPEDGGCTEFINGRKIRPECGKLIINPASWTYAHCGNEIKTDYKYILTFMIFTGSG
jgi:hypothetical protein